MNKNSQLSLLFYVIVALTAFGFCFNFIAFVSPHWIQSVPESHSQFQRIGLWTVCFDGYMRPSAYDRAYFGCYYIYYVIYDAIRDWLNPAWLYAIQCVSSLGMLIHFIVLFITLSQCTKALCRTNIRLIKFNIVGNLFVSLTLVAALVAFAVARYDSRWMPYPDFNVLSWSYAMAVISFTVTFSTFILTFMYYLSLDSLPDPENDELIDNEKPIIQNKSYFTGRSQLGNLDEVENEMYPDVETKYMEQSGNIGVNESLVFLDRNNAENNNQHFGQIYEPYDPRV